VKPYENHIIHNKSDLQICELLIIISAPYDKQDPDTFSIDKVSDINGKD